MWCSCTFSHNWKEANYCESQWQSSIWPYDLWNGAAEEQVSTSRQHCKLSRKKTTGAHLWITITVTILCTPLPQAQLKWNSCRLLKEVKYVHYRINHKKSAQLYFFIIMNTWTCTYVLPGHNSPPPDGSSGPYSHITCTWQIVHAGYSDHDYIIICCIVW